ncbi:MAG TPA: tRNA (N(6)-L-threonylcarbamoyladenosine(37)-C(2))-methylthiotransferase MtaB [Dictyoglomaceae bacterium]|nr:tRNA (N(6)-L-threonylcarbamoyladenosine(37)-C(2))-methylthiotransferase MtaB [Dictyoglomaceae bacterium]HPU44370.1 tRNA (N(6)-L-threonylcarbamoyladenosine(37)-C(2))-methylthiotransferase MtaB [Dictyoglomaceae bacterium]
MRKRIAFYTFGCKVNQYETEKLRQLALKEGWEVVPFGEKADVLFINSCAVTHVAERKARRLINFIRHHYPNIKIILAGCYPEKLKICPSSLNVNLVLDNKEKWEFFNSNGEESLPVAVGDRTRAVVKIQDGCNQFCTYCLVPYFRGRERSKPLHVVLEEINNLLNLGYKEIVLTGIRLGAYGHDFGNKDALAELLERIFVFPQLKRVRLSSIELIDITDRLIELSNYFKFCRHWHIPLQSGDDDILRKMNRKYTIYDFQQVVEKIREKVPEVAITTDIIVGYPQETEENFENTYYFASQIKFMKIHVFPFSPRPGTSAAKLKPLPSNVVEERKEKLISLSSQLWKDYAKKFIGKDLEVLVEEKEGEYYKGTSDNYLKVAFKNTDDIQKGSFVKVKIKDIDKEENNIVLGELVKEESKIR